MEKVVIAAASNIDHIEIKERKSRSFLNGAAVYAGYASATQNETRVITCVGDEIENEEIVENAKKYRLSQIPQFDVIKMNGGKSFKQTFTDVNGKYEVTNKDYGNYNDWAPEIEPFSTDTLLLGSGNPIFHKCVLDACTSANHILLDSKSIHLKIRAEKMDALLKRVDTFFGTQEEIRQLLQNCGLPITMTSELFNKYPNLKVIVEKNAGDGGRVFTSDGTLYKYQPEKPSNEKCVDGAGDVFAGVWSGMLSNGEDLKSIIRKSAEISAEAVRHFTLGKIKSGSYISPDIKIIIEESRWKSRIGRDEKDTNRSN